jgi:hypothetical protein
MKVKVIRKGYCGKQLREEGSIFNWPGDKCPPWCLSLEEETITKSKGSTIENCVPLFAGLSTVDEVEEFVAGDTRAGIKALAEERISELSK